MREYTPIVTTVHPLQVIDDRIAMRAHDIPVDFLVTPDQVVAAPSLYPRPRGILWDLLPDERIRAIPALRKGRREGRGTLTPARSEHPHRRACGVAYLPDAPAVE